MFSCNGFDTQYGRASLRSAQESFKGATEEVKGFRCVGIGMEGTIGTSVSRFSSDNGTAEIPDKPEMLLEPRKVLVPLVRIGMHGIDVATKNGDGDAPGLKDTAEPAGVAWAQGCSGPTGVGDGFGECQLDG